MSDEYDNNPVIFSSFIPFMVLLVGLLVWAGYQDYAVNAQRAFYKQQLEQASPVFDAARNWQARYGSLMKDLNQTAAKDPAAATILKEAVQAGIQAGLIKVNQNQPADASGTTTSVATPAAPDAAK